MHRITSVQTFLVILAPLFQGSLATPPLQLNILSGPGEDFDSFKNEIFNTVRLPRVLIPSHYNLEIRPILTNGDPDLFKAPGKVTIRMRCIASTNNITLHAFDIDILHANVTVTSVSNGVDIPVVGHTNSSSLQTYTIDLLSPGLVAGVEYDVTIPFIANVGDRMSGLYRSWYIGADGIPVYHATTQFQKLGARMAFPCFDEPNFRAIFNIKIGRLSTGYNSLCNSPLEDTIPIPEMNNWVWDVYGSTVNMPTYLVAIIVSDFVNITAPEELSKYEVKTWGPPTMTNAASGEFSARAAAMILNFFETYYDSVYQFPKLDSVAIPQFEAGAMENWALNTYRTVLMLWYEGESTQFEQWRQAAVIAHEISHHWFGDLVTCDWWNDLWLNEGFARYMQFLGANEALPNHGVMDRYTIDVIQLAMDFDAGPTTEPVRSNATDIVNNQNSRIIYEKAGALIRMMQGFLTEATLIVGLQNYLDVYAYQNTVQDQLFTELQAQAERDGTVQPYTVKDIMDTWTLKSGFPVVKLTRAGANVVFISQERFVPLEQREMTQDPFELWYVPIAYATKQNPDFTSPINIQPKFWLDKFTLATTKVIEDNTAEWIIINPDARSFYRVIYDSHFFSLILTQLADNHTDISVSSRSQIMDDYFKSAWAAYVPLERALDLTKYLDQERENTVWTTVFNNLRQMNRYLQDRPSVYATWKTYLLSKITPALEDIGWEQDATDIPVKVILRSQLLDWACSLGAARCDEIAIMYAEGVAGGTNIPADIQPMMYCKAVSLADTLTNFDIKTHVLENYRVATRVERHTVFINSLACNAPKMIEIEGLLDSVIASPSDFTATHAVQLMQRLADNPDNREFVVQWLQINLLPVITNLNQSAVSSVITTLASYTSEPSIIRQMEDLITAALERVDQDSVVAALNAARLQLTKNVAWMNSYAPLIEVWIDSASANP